MNPHQKNKIDISVSSPTKLPIHSLTISSHCLQTSSGSSACTASCQTRKISYKTSLRYIVLSSYKGHPANTTQERKYFDSGDYALSKAGKAGDTGVTTIGTEHPTAEKIPHTSPLNHIVSRSDSIAGGSPPTPSISTNNPSLSQVGAVDGASPTLAGPTPAGMHRGSINGIPGGNLNLPPPTGSISLVNSRSPQKESYLNRSSSIDDPEGEQQRDGLRDLDQNVDGKERVLESVSPPPKKEGIPIRR